MIFWNGESASAIALVEHKYNNKIENSISRTDF